MSWAFVNLARVEADHAATVRFWQGRAHAAELATDSVSRQLNHALDVERARYDTLLEKYHALASPPPPEKAVAVPQIDRVPSIVTQAIKDESGGDPRLAAWLRKRATELKREGKTDAEIRDQLGAWQSTEEETAA